MSPASPDFLNLTDDQIDLEWELYKQENPDKFKDDQYFDPEYEEWEKKAQEEDNKLIISTDVQQNDVKESEEGWMDIPVEQQER